MFIEGYDRPGGQPIRVFLNQVVIYADNGTPLAIAAVAGPKGMIHVSHAKDPSFNRDLQVFGVPHTVIYDEVDGGEPPEGAKLLIDPGVINGS
jgi:hypothetical protein